MTALIDPAIVTQFSAEVHVKAQQMQSRMRPRTMQKMVVGQDFAYDDLGDLEAVEITQRHQPTVGQDIASGRRRLRMREFRATIYLDKKDSLEVLVDAQREYSAAVARAMFRKYDKIAIEAAFATVNTGRQFETSVTFAADGGLIVDATGGATYETLLELSKNFMNNDVGNDMPEQTYLTVTGEEHEDFMGENELTSGDFSRQFVVDKGKMTMAAGFDLVPFAGLATVPIISVSSSTRSNVAASTRGICVGMSKDLSIEVDKRPDLNNLTQVQASMFMGAVRTEGKLVQKYNTTTAL